MNENGNAKEPGNMTSFEGLNLERCDGGWLVRSYEGIADELAIPSQVDGDLLVMIAANAFEGAVSLKHVEIPDTVTFVGNYAFWNCTGLKSVRMGNGVRALTLGTFMGCTSLTEVILPESLETLGDGVFSSCTSLPTQEIPQTVKTLGDSCFRNCTSLTSIVLPAAITTIMRNCFRGCTALATVIMHGNVEYIGPRAFQECPSLESITFAERAISTTMNAMRNYSLMCFVADEAIARGMLSFEEAKKLLNSESDRERILAARALATFPDRFGEIPLKQKLTATLAGAGKTVELHAFEGVPGYFTKPALLKCIDAANAGGHAQTAAYLLGLLAQLDGPAPVHRSTGLEL